MLIVSERELYEYAEFAQTKLIEWFGEPADMDWTYTIELYRYSALERDPFRHTYTIFLRKDYKSKEQFFADVAHEIYHRVTNWRSGLRRLMWVDEMIAFLATQHVLRGTGLSDYADVIKDHHYNRGNDEIPLNIRQLRRYNHRRPFPGILGSNYPKTFGNSVALIGLSLEEAVGWEAICRLTFAINWNEWYSWLSPDAASQARQLLLAGQTM
jgi:hypothetical protein